MFCKWCGADIPNSATKCTRCGKEVPAMSDCGGFYDLVPNAKRSATGGSIPPRVDPVPVEPIKTDPPKKETPPKGKKSNGRKNSGLQLVVTCIGFVLVIVLLLALNGKVGDGFAKLEDINGRIDAIFAELHQLNEATNPSEEDNTTHPTGEAVPNEVFLDEQDTLIEIDVEHTDAGSKVKTTADLGDFDDVVIDQVSFDKDTHSLSAVQIDLSEAENCININVENTLSKTSKRKGTISVEFDIEESLFANVAGDEEYEWAYRITGSTEWASLDEDVFTISADGTTVTYSASNLVDLLEDAEMVEFSLTYKRANTKDGSLTIIISGITVTKQTLEVRSNT